MGYRIEPTEIPGEFVRVDNGPTDIKGTLIEIEGMIGEAYCAVAAVARFMYGEDPVRSVPRKEDPKCFAAEMTETKSRAAELCELAQTLAKRLGA